MARTTTTTTLRLSADERAALDLAAQAEGLGPSAFARLAVVRAAGGTPTPTRKRRSEIAKAIALVLGELGRVGSNLNQVARRANRGGSVEPAELDAIRSELERMTLSVLSLREAAP
ncbi:plasmid mobilization protein [Tianweitania sediminis]|uniref:Plasmid mobilization relaxosome protein MobC n=1 Tax=Tianweitania sediminis TaxID=1502156 RepID=A0A8J7UM09_9HYPH|nr:plasmid mobilization relaxosome protein MobC [Tianweitania sediminis]MBP0441510.1 plasmid mobilization relaxosome protein MobC [Tianweitania sediminis]